MNIAVKYAAGPSVVPPMQGKVLDLLLARVAPDTEMTGHPAIFSPDIRQTKKRLKLFFIAGYPANATGYQAGYRISKRADIQPAGHPV